MGARGNTGATGPRGPRGVRGATGAIGSRGRTGKPGQKGPTGLRGLRGSLHKDDALNAVVTNFDDVYRELTRPMVLIATLQQQLAVRAARRADLPAGVAPDPVPFRCAS
jgi:collagen triple helix repeat protein